MYYNESLITGVFTKRHCQTVTSERRIDSGPALPTGSSATALPAQSSVFYAPERTYTFSNTAQVYLIKAISKLTKYKIQNTHK